MKSSSSTPKGKFFPPIRTAASFLRTVSKSPELTSQSPPHTLTSKDIIPELSISKQITSFIKDSGTFTERATASRKFRDYQQLQEVLRSPDPDTRSFNNFPFPTTLDQLRLFTRPAKRAPSLKETQTKEKPGSPSPRLFLESESKISFEDSRKSNKDCYNLDNLKLKEWLVYMKKQFFECFFKDSFDKQPTADSFNRLEAFKLVLRIAWQECVRLVSFQSLERGGIISDLIKYTKKYCKVKNVDTRNKLNNQVLDLQRKVDTLLDELSKVSATTREKEDLYLHEIGPLKSNLMIKEVDISRHLEYIKLLKADRTFRIKRDLEKYNQLLTKFGEFRLTCMNHVSDPVMVRKLSHRKDSIKECVLTKLNIIQDKKLASGSRLTEEQLIEHEMLSTNTDMIFFEKASQANILKETRSQSVQLEIEFSDKEVLTDEILDIFEENLQNETFRQPNIMITNEDLVEIEFNTFTDKLNEISIIEENLDLDFIQSKPKEPVKKRVNSFYRWRENESKETQTEEKVFVEVARQEEEELLEWMIKDRKDYLKGIQKQIFHKKNELSKVHVLVNKSRSMLGESFNIEDSKNLSFISSEDSEDLIENEIIYLKSVGLLNSEVEIESWKNGYYYGYEKGKNDAFTTDPPQDPVNQSACDVPVEATEGENTKSKRRMTIISDSIRNMRRGTKVQEFNFQHKDSKTALKLNLKPRHKYIDDFLQESSKSILKLAKMSRKMMIKTINSLYSAASVKRTQGDVQDLATFLYEEFSARYGQKIMNKKLVEFLASVMKYPDSRRAINFAKIIGISKKIGLEEFVRPKEIFDFILEFTNLIQRSNLGIIYNIEEGIDYQFIPAIRAVECSKEILSKIFDSSRISAVITKIEQNSHPDPKKINKFGIIDQEFLSEMLLIELDLHHQSHLDAIWTLFESFYSTRNILKIFKHDVVMMVRHLSPDKFHLIGNSGEGLAKIQDFDDSSFTIPAAKVVDFCFQMNLVTNRDLEGFLNRGFDEEKIKEAVKLNHEVLKGELMKIFDRKENFGFNSLYITEWQIRFEDLVSPGEKDWKNVYLVWTILNLEVQRLSSNL